MTSEVALKVTLVFFIYLLYPYSYEISYFFLLLGIFLYKYIFVSIQRLYVYEIVYFIDHVFFVLDHVVEF